MSKIIKIVLLLVIVVIEIIAVSLLYNKWFDTLDMINSDATFSPEEYYNRPSKIWENIIFYTTIILFLLADFIYIKKVLLKK